MQNESKEESREANCGSKLVEMMQISKVTLRNWTAFYDAQSTECTTAPAFFLLP